MEPEYGTFLHDKGYQFDTVVGNTLVDMYAKCGIPAKAQEVLEELPIRNIVSWNALIAGYAQEGQGYEALKCFEQLKRSGLSPNEVTLLSSLTACAHSGLLHEAQLLFTEMMTKYGISPNLQHHTCMVFAYGNAGLFWEAMSVIKAMPSFDNAAIWLALLSSCLKWGNVRLGRLAFAQALQMENDCSAAYILMANTFAAAGMQDDAERVETIKLKYAARSKEERKLCDTL